VLCIRCYAVNTVLAFSGPSGTISPECAGAYQVMCRKVRLMRQPSMDLIVKRETKIKYKIRGRHRLDSRVPQTLYCTSKSNEGDLCKPSS
jgi:hypothetical protein